MSTAVAARPAVALPSVVRVSLSRTALELKSFFRRREAVVFTFSLPVVLLIIFGSIFHGTVGTTGVSFRLYFTAGIIASGIMSTTFVNLGISIVLEREDGTLKRLAGTPMPKAAYFTGKALSSLVIAAIEVAILLGIGIAAYGLKLPDSAERWLTFTWVFLLGVATCTMLGIGQRLFISEATVKTHLLRAFGKLGVSDRTAAVTTAIQRGDIPPPGR